MIGGYFCPKTHVILRNRASNCCMRSFRCRLASGLAQDIFRFMACLCLGSLKEGVPWFQGLRDPPPYVLSLLGPALPRERPAEMKARLGPCSVLAASGGPGHSPGRTAPGGPPRAPRSPRSASWVPAIVIMAGVNRSCKGGGGPDWARSHLQDHRKSHTKTRCQRLCLPSERGWDCIPGHGE